MSKKFSVAQQMPKVDLRKLILEKLDKGKRGKTKKVSIGYIKGLGSYKLFRCDKCRYILCSARILDKENGEKWVCKDCGKDLVRVLAPTYRRG